MNKFKLNTLLIPCLFFFGCASSNDRYQITNDHSPTEIPPLEHIEDVTPRYESYSRGGNKNYSVRGIDYKVYKNITEFTESGNASWYGNKFHGHLTSNGERYNMFAMSAAHKNLPLPSYVQVTNLENNKQVIVRVNDRGPFHEGRIIDLSYAAAYKLDMLKSGTAKVKIKLLHFPKNTVQSAQEKKHYFVQYLVTSEHAKAQKLDKEISKKYQEKSLYLKDKNIYKLRLGPFKNKSSAEKIQEKIQQQYPNAYIVYP